MDSGGGGQKYIQPFLRGYFDPVYRDGGLLSKKYHNMTLLLKKK